MTNTNESLSIKNNETSKADFLLILGQTPSVSAGKKLAINFCVIAVVVGVGVMLLTSNPGPSYNRSALPMLGGIVLLITVSIGGIFLFKSLGAFFVESFSGAGVDSYGKARQAIVNGDIIPSYCLRDYSGLGFILVDETNRKIFVGTKVYAFVDVLRIRTEDDTRDRTHQWFSLVFEMNDHAAPVRKMPYDTKALQEANFVRVCNSLGLS